MYKKVSSIILAAGRGKRLKGINYPKSLIKINENESLIKNIIKVLEDNNIYDLFAVSCHSGGLGGGHYTATVQQYTTGKWIDCNDARVSDLGSDPTSTLRASAYILMYRRRKSSSNMLTNGTSTNTSGNVSVSKSGRVRGAML